MMQMKPMEELDRGEMSVVLQDSKQTVLSVNTASEYWVVIVSVCLSVCLSAHIHTGSVCMCLFCLFSHSLPPQQVVMYCLMCWVLCLDCIYKVLLKVLQDSLLITTCLTSWNYTLHQGQWFGLIFSYICNGLSCRLLARGKGDVQDVYDLIG